MFTTGKKIKKLREKENITQKELALALGVTRDVVANWETDRGLPTSDILPKLAKYFSVPTDHFLIDDPSPKIRIEINDPGGIYSVSDAERLLSDAKVALAEAVQGGHITQEKADEAAELAWKQLMMILEQSKK